MLRAAVAGKIDFAEAELLDLWWHIKLELVLGELVDQELLEYLRISQLRHLSYLGVPGLDQADWERHRDSEHEVYQQYVRLLVGADDNEERTRKEQLQSALKRAWENEFGSTDDPATQIRIDATALQLKLQREQGGQSGAV